MVTAMPGLELTGKTVKGGRRKGDGMGGGS
jgi:hypothetical protein